MGKKRVKKQHISADGTPYTIWQLRTRWLCLALLVWAILELSGGIGLFSLSVLNIFHLQELVPALSVGPYTIANGAVNIVVAILGLWGAYNPKRITVFFWLVVLDALLSSWSTASAVSQGQIDPATTLSLVIVLAFAACAWNVRGQTGYFDNHPHPDEDDVLPLEKGMQTVQHVVKKEEEQLKQTADGIVDLSERFESERNQQKG